VSTPLATHAAKRHFLPRLGIVAAAALALLVTATWMAATAMRGSSSVVLLDGGPSPVTAEAAPDIADPFRYFSLDGDDPQEAPSGRTGLGFFDLDDPLVTVLDVLGPPVSTGPDINATTAHTWMLPGDAELTVITDDGPARQIVGVYAEVPSVSPVRLPLQHHVVLGQTTAAALLALWGEHGAVRGDALSDYLVAYTECRGPFPIVIKFGTTAAAPAGVPEAPGDEPVTSVLIAYADDAPGTAGCPAAGRET
jgi:hypothetical protein